MALCGHRNVEKQKIAIAKPLVYDIGWTITDRVGNIYKKVNYLIQETFFVPNVFNTAYYCNKRPETYIKHLYSADYNEWEKIQKKKCRSIINGKNKAENPDYLKPFFEIRGHRFPIADLWGIACDRLINIDKYRNYCLENELLTASALFFKTSAETAFQYLMKQYDFIEDHTALSDAEIEAQILTKALKKGKIEPSIKAFPFRELGKTTDYVTEKKPKYKENVVTALEKYITENNGFNKKSGYWTNICKTLELLKEGE